MKYKLLSTTDYTEPWLNAKHPQTGTVHSVYDGAVNLMVHGQLIALQPADSPVSPLTVRCDFPLSDLAAAQGDAVTVGRGAIQLKNAALAVTGDTAVEQTRLMTEADTDRDAYRIKGMKMGLGLAKTYADRADAILDHCGDITAGFRPLFSNAPKSDGDLFTAAVNETLAKAKAAFLALDGAGFAAALCQLAGLGPGLTPSGDDFLCGVFAAFRAVGAWYHPVVPYLLSELTHLEERTHPLSAAFINCAAEGYVSKIILNFFASDQSVFNAAEMAEKFKEIGHSSGIDSLCGITFVLKFLCQPS